MKKVGRWNSEEMHRLMKVRRNLEADVLRAQAKSLACAHNQRDTLIVGMAWQQLVRM